MGTVIYSASLLQAFQGYSLLSWSCSYSGSWDSQPLSFNQNVEKARGSQWAPPVHSY